MTYERGLHTAVVSGVASSALMLLILFVKRGLKKHITTRGQYNIDLLFLVVLTIPFLPAGLVDFLNLGTDWLGGLFSSQGTIMGVSQTATGAAQEVGGTNWLQDFSLSVDLASPGFVAPFLMVLWLTGIVVLIVFTWRCNRELRLAVESMKPIMDDEMVALFNRCKAELHIKRRILCGTSIMARSPMTVGLFRTRIILPTGIEKTSSEENIRYILLHELTHCKNRDIPINNLMCAFQILYWFNPVVYFVFRGMRLDRELTCDLSVLKHIPEERHLAYGQTLLCFADKLSRRSVLSFAADMGGSKRQITKRIEGIVSFVKESKLLWTKSVCIFALVGMIVLLQIPTIAALAASGSDIYHWNDGNVVYEDLSAHFEDFKGSFVMYDLESNQYSIYNKERSIERVSPNSTYKLYSALIALETGTISATRSVQAWDRTTYPIEAWNQDQNLESAMQNNGHAINGWFIGYVEKDERTVIFATNIQGSDNANGSSAARITLSILEDKGIY